MPVIIDGTSGVTTPTYGGADTSEYLVPVTQFKNRIINGAMVIDQRNAGASVNNDNTGTQYSLDRWSVFGSTSSRFSVQQNAGSVTPPAGFRNYLGVTSLAATSLAAGDIYIIRQMIEGFNTADLMWGTVNAQTITLSFWARSSLTGTFGGALSNNASNRVYPFSYTISSANTWEQKSITIAGDTTGTWLTNNSTGIEVRFGLGVGTTNSGTAGAWGTSQAFSATGATSVVGTNGATFYITGVQLEVGSTATSFDYRPYGTELALCQRYYQLVLKGTNFPIGIAAYTTATRIDVVVPFKVTMRGSPSMVLATGTNYYDVYRAGADDFMNSIDLADVNTDFANLRNTSEVSGTAGQAGYFLSTNASASLAFVSEL